MLGLFHYSIVIAERWHEVAPFSQFCMFISHCEARASNIRVTARVIAAYRLQSIGLHEVIPTLKVWDLSLREHLSAILCSEQTQADAWMLLS